LSLSKRVGDVALKLLYSRVKTGFGVNDDQSKKPSAVKLKEKSKSYIDTLEGKVQFRKVRGKTIPFTKDKDGKKLSPIKPGGELYRAGLSNLTLSGQLLKAIENLSTRGKIVLSINKKTRAPVKGMESKKQLTNRELADLVRKERPFFALTKDEQDIVKSDFARWYRAILAKKLK